MKIAVTYDNGNVFQHFGKTESFKLYEVEADAVISSEIIGSDGAGHEALADFLAAKGVKLLICGGLGGGAQAALAEAGILVISGAEGSADEAVEKFLKGELVSAGVNCDHHHDEEEHHCGGDCGGCHGCHPMFEGPNVGKQVKVHYTGTFNDGSKFDSSYDRGEPLAFTCGEGQMIPGFDKAVAVMELGQTVNVHLMPEEAYGEKNPGAIFPIPVADLAGSEDLQAGEKVYLYDEMNRPIPVTVVSNDGATVVFDANHEMAGKELNFEITLVDVKD